MCRGEIWKLCIPLRSSETKVFKNTRNFEHLLVEETLVFLRRGLS